MKHLLKKNKFPKLALFALVWLGCSLSVNAQDGHTVTGKILDELGTPLPGAAVVEKGTTNGTSSDFDGNFSLNVSNKNAILLITYIGYDEQEIALNGRSEINVTMVSTASTLDEVVVVGYGAVKKRDLTGAIAQVDASDAANQSTTSVTDILRARVPGLSIGFSNSPKGVSSLEVRGNNSLTAGSSPLIVLDGMIYNGDLSDISPNDIDKVDVMKDASSAAVYGARGSNGVILITTKRGETEKPLITINTSIGMVTDASRLKPYSAQGYVNWRSDVFKSINVGHEAFPGRYDDPSNLPAGVTLDQWLAYDGSQGDPTRVWLNRIGFKDIEIDNYLAGKSIDWYDRIIQNGIRNEQDISLSGRNKGVNYYWSLGRVSNEDIVLGEKFENLRTRLNLDANVTDYLKVGLNAQFAKRNEGFIAADGSQISASSPWGSEFDDEGNPRLSPQDDTGAGARNAFLDMMFNDRVDLGYTLNSRMFAKLDLPLGFSYELAYSNRLEFNEFFNHASSKSPANVIGSARRQNQKIEEWQLDNILNWNKSFNKHSFGLTFLFNAEKFQSFVTDARSNTFEPNDNLGYHNLESGTIQTASSEDAQSTGDAFMSRLNYNYDSRYLVTLTMRRDGYSAFGGNFKRAHFPSIAGAWTISEEKFFSSNFVNFLKLRLSYGENGNRDLRDNNGNIIRYAALSQLGAGKYLNVDESGNVISVATLDNTTQENADLKWERTTAANIGLDFSFANGRVEGSFDVYRNVTNDLIVTRQLPNIIGFNSVLTNLGEVQNKGLEFYVATKNFTKEDFTWGSSFNFALNRNKLTKLYGDLDEDGNELDDTTNQRFIGEATDVIWGQEAVGIYQLEDADEAAQFGVSPGDWKVLDVNNDGQYTIEDHTFQGHRKPRFTWALSNQFTFFKNLDFSFDIYSQWGQKRAFNQAKNNAGFIDRTNSLQIPYWTPDNPLNDHARLFSSNGSANFTIWRNSSFIRLNNVTLGYRFPEKLLNKLQVHSLRVYANVRNAAVWAPDWDFFDPESDNVNGRSGSLSGRRFFTFGINLSL